MKFSESKEETYYFHCRPNNVVGTSYLQFVEETRKVTVYHP